MFPEYARYIEKYLNENLSSFSKIAGRKIVAFAVCRWKLLKLLRPELVCVLIRIFSYEFRNILLAWKCCKNESYV